MTIKEVLVGSIVFFSSRRRSTRFSRDWSSDVCSSDLPKGFAGRPDALEVIASRLRHPARFGRVGEHFLAHLGFGLAQHLFGLFSYGRGEEIERADRVELAALLVENARDRAGLRDPVARAQP